MRGRRPLFATGALLLSTLVALLLAEVGLRVYFGSREPADFAVALRNARNAPRTGALALGQIVQASAWPDIVYELRPGLDGTFRGQTLRTNSLGLRGAREYARPKPAGTFRIVGLGDSNLFGWGVGEGEPYLQILEKRLGPHVEALNFGVPGHNGVMEVATYEHRAAALDPDLVILHFIGNDFGLPHFLQAPEEARSPVRSYLWELLEARFGSKEDEVDPGLLPHDRSKLDPELRRQARGRYAHMVGPEAYKKAMARLGELTRARGIPVIILSLGGSGEQGNLAQEAAQANGFTFLDASPRFYRHLVENHLGDGKEVWRTTFRIPHDGHPNRLAHALYAEVLEEAVRPLVQGGIGVTAVAARATKTAAHASPLPINTSLIAACITKMPIAITAITIRITPIEICMTRIASCVTNLPIRIHPTGIGVMRISNFVMHLASGVTPMRILVSPIRIFVTQLAIFVMQLVIGVPSAGPAVKRGYLPV